MQDSSVLSHDERERKLRDERSNKALRLQRKQRLEALVHKRKSNIVYLKKVHEGGAFWLNCILLSTADIQRYVQTVVPKQRSTMFFFLGLSISKFLEEVDVGIPSVQAFAQLVEEWEYCFAGPAMQSVKFVIARNSTSAFPNSMQDDSMDNISSNSASASSIDGSSSSSNSSSSSSSSSGSKSEPLLTPSSAAIPPTGTNMSNQDGNHGTEVCHGNMSGSSASMIAVPAINKFNNSIVFEYLQTPSVPFDLDYIEVVLGLSEVLLKLYDNFLHEDCYGYVLLLAFHDGGDDRLFFSLLLSDSPSTIPHPSPFASAMPIRKFISY